MNFFLASFGVYAQEKTIESQIENSFSQGLNYLYSQRDSTYFYFDKATALSLQHNDLETALQLVNYSIYANGYHYDLENYYYNLRRSDSLIRLVKTTPENLASYTTNYILNTGNYYYKLGDYTTALTYFKELYSSLSSEKIENLTPENKEMLNSVLSFLATSYKNTGKYELADTYFLKNKSFISSTTKNQEQLKYEIANIDRLRAQLFSEQEDYAQSNSLFQSVLQIYTPEFTENQGFKNVILSTYQVLTQNYIAQDSLEKALQTMTQSQEFYLEKDPFHKKALELLGDIYLKQKQYKKAITSYSKALKDYQIYRKGKPHQDIAAIQLKIAQVYLEENNPDAGLAAIQKALKSAGNYEKSFSLEENPNPNSVFSKRQLLQLLDTKLALLIQANKFNNKPVYQKSILNLNRDALATFDLLKREFNSKLDKSFLVQKAYPLFYNMLDALYSIYAKDPSEELFELALQVAEKNKDLFLLETIKTSRAAEFASVPNEIINQEKLYTSQINHIEKQLFIQEDLEFTHELTDSLFSLKNNYYSFLDKLSETYPKYYELKYAGFELNLKKVEAYLYHNKTTLISYTMAPSYLYVFVLTGKEQHYLRIPITASDRRKIKDFRDMLSHPALDNYTQELEGLSHQLYTKILAPVQESIQTNSLLIIPDGLLQYIPFGLLVNDSKEYVLKHTAITYEGSLATWIELVDKPHKKHNKLLAFAPSFDPASDNQFTKLLYNEEEIEGVAAYFKNSVYANKAATLKEFLQDAPQSNLIHLATHASANDEFPDYSYLAFSPENKESNLLYVKDLYKLNLDADLITLSACETGIGKLQKGEGMLSLSKGFYYAGAKSIVKSLWKINDKSTAFIMEHFYAELNKGKPKDIALQNAQLAYLNTVEDPLLKHPYYWAGFVVSGNPVAIVSKPIWQSYGLIAGLVLLLVLFLFRKKLIQFIQ